MYKEGEIERRTDRGTGVTSLKERIDEEKVGSYHTSVNPVIL